MFGANSSATPDGGLLQLRALDWNVDGVYGYSTNKTSVIYILLQVPSETTLRLLCTIPTLVMVMPLLTLDGQDGLDPSLVRHNTLNSYEWYNMYIHCRHFLREDGNIRDWSIFSRR